MKKLVIGFIILVGLLGFASGVEFGLSVEATVTASPLAFEILEPEMSVGYGFDVGDGRLGVGIANISKLIKMEIVPYIDFFYPLWRDLGIGARVDYQVYPFDFEANKPNVFIELGLDKMKFDLKVFPEFSFGLKFEVFF